MKLLNKIFSFLFGWLLPEEQKTVYISRMPMFGDKGSHVQALQEILVSKGYALVVDGHFGPKTRDAVSQFQKSINLPGSGILGPKTLVALNLQLDAVEQPPVHMDGKFTKQKMLSIAKTEAEKRLVWSPGSEADKYKKKFWGAFGKGKWPWCAAFVTWCCEKAGLEMPINNPSSFGYTFALCEAWQQWAISRGFYFDNDGIFVPSPGDIVLFDWDQLDIHEVDRDWENHIGVHAYMNGSKFVCYEGNTSNRTDTKERNAIQIQGWIRIPDGYQF